MSSLMKDNWNTTYYHGYKILGKSVPPDGDSTKWVAEIYIQDKLIFRIRLNSNRIANGMSEEGMIELSNEGLKRIHSRIDFGDFNAGDLYEYHISSYGEELSHPYHDRYGGVFDSQIERMSFHMLDILRRIKMESPGHLDISDYDLSGWAYYLDIEEEQIYPVMMKLKQENLISFVEVPNPRVSGSFLPAGGVGITPQGYKYLEELEKTFVERIRESVMPDIKENAYIVLGILYEAGSTSEAKSTNSRKIIDLSGLSSDEFNKVENFLVSAELIRHTTNDLDINQWLTPYGISWFKEEQEDRISLSINAQRIVRYVAEKTIDPIKTIVSSSEITSELDLDDSQFRQLCNELADRGLLEDKRVDDTTPFAAVGLTPMGRNAYRENFKKQTSLFQQQNIGAIFNAPVSNSNIQAIASASNSNVQQAVSQNDNNAIQGEISNLIEELVKLVNQDLNIKESAAYTQAAKDLIEEIDKQNPDPTLAQKLFGILAFTANVDGAIDLGMKGFELAVKYGPIIFTLQQSIFQYLQMSGG